MNCHSLATLNVARLQRLFSEQNYLQLSLVIRTHSYYSNLHLAFLSLANFRREATSNKCHCFTCPAALTFFLPFIYLVLVM